MRQRIRIAPLAALCLILLVAACGKKSTSPTTGGGTGFDSRAIPAGGTFSHKFDVVGAFPYHCERHNGMTGSVTVQGGAASAVAVDIAGSAFSPQGVTVGQGSTVTWTNKDGVTHTVTSD
jgi:plastocyanin